MPAIQPFAIMRLTHDALRVGMTEVEDALPLLESEGVGPVRRALEPLAATLALHRRQEDEQFFPVLNRVADQAVSKAGLHEEHEHDVDDLGAIEAILSSYSADRETELTRTLRSWMKDMGEHLEHEEAVMMPLIGRTANTVESQAAIVRQIVSVDLPGFLEVQIPYVVERLGGSAFAPKLPMFLRALTVVLTESELAAAQVSVTEVDQDVTVSCRYDPRNETAPKEAR